MSDDLIFSIIICTHNRSSYLSLALESLSRLRPPVGRYEVLVIDNASTDQTAKIVAPWLSSGLFRYFYEKKPGLSRARNRGWREARGEWIVYLDDDAIASPQLLVGYERALRCFSEKPGCVAGRVGLIWPKIPPSWMSRSLQGYLGELDWGNEPKLMSPDQWVVGANCMFSQSALEMVGGFTEDLGRKRNNLLSCEESFLRLKMEEYGFVAAYAPEALAWHHVASERLTKKWFYNRSYWQGVSTARMEYLLGHNTLGTKLCNLVKSVQEAVYNTVKSFFPPNESDQSSMHFACRSLRFYGRAVEIFSLIFIGYYSWPKQK